MKDKKIILLTLIFGILICLLVTALFIIFYLPSQIIVDPANPVSSPTGNNGNTNIIKINPNSNIDFKYAMVTNEDTVELRNNIGEKQIIGLTHQNWKDPKWSPDNQLVSVLARTNGGNYDIYVYILSSKSWVQATNFSDQPSGVDSYVWTNNNILLFTQGTTPNRWLHRFNFVTRNEIVKLKRIEGNITSISPDRNNLVVLDNNIYSIYSTDGIKLSTLENLKDQTNKLISVNEVSINKDSTKMLLVDSNNKLHKSDLLGKTVVSVDPKSDFTNVCNFNTNLYLGYTFNAQTQTIKSLTVNVLENSASVLAQTTLKNVLSIYQEQSSCFETNSVLLKVQKSDPENAAIISNVWLRSKDSGFEEMTIFATAEEIGVVN